MSHEKSRLVQPVRRELVEVADIDFVFEEVCICRGTGQRGTPGALVLRRTMLVGITDPELISVRKVVKDTTGSEEVMRRVWKRLSDRAEAQRFSGGNRADVHDVLLVENVFIEREQKTGALTVAERS